MLSVSLKLHILGHANVEHFNLRQQVAVHLEPDVMELVIFGVRKQSLHNRESEILRAITRDPAFPFSHPLMRLSVFKSVPVLASHAKKKNHFPGIGAALDSGVI